MNCRTLLYLVVCTAFFWGTSAQGYTIVWDVVSNPITAQGYAYGNTVEDEDFRVALFHVQKENAAEADTFDVTLSVSYEYSLLNGGSGDFSEVTAFLFGEQSGGANDGSDLFNIDLIDGGTRNGAGDLEVTFLGDVHTDMQAFTHAWMGANSVSIGENFRGVYAEVLMNAVTVDVVGREMAPVPEPATMLLFGTGLAGLAGYRKRKAKK